MHVSVTISSGGIIDHEISEFFNSKDLICFKKGENKIYFAFSHYLLKKVLTYYIINKSLEKCRDAKFTSSSDISSQTTLKI